MTRIKFSALEVAVAALLTVLGGASASADDYLNSVRLGSESVFYHTTADNVSGPYVPPGVNIDAQNLETMYAGYVRTLTAHFAVELALGYPPLAKVQGRGLPSVGSVPYNGQVVSSARWLAPTLFLEYNFLPPDSLFRPYLGVGVNYTNFYDRDTTAAGNAAFGGPTKISLTASVEPAVTGGLDYHVSKRWHVYASYSWSNVKTNLTADTAGVIRTTRINFSPRVVVVSAGFSF
jgi:outer membrane protein